MSQSNSTSNSSSSDVTTHPAISGSQNVSANGRVIPIIMGRTFFTPYYMGRVSNGYTYIYGTDGEKQGYRNLFVIGQKDIRVTDVKLGNHRISDNNGVTAGVLPSKNYDESQSSKEIVENGELPLNYLTKDTLLKPSEYKTILELKQDDTEISFFNQKIIETSFNNELKAVLNKEEEKIDSVYNYAFSARFPHKVQVQIEFPNGLYADSILELGKAVICVEMSLDGGNTWQPFGNFDGSNASGTVKVESESTTSFAYNKKEHIRFVATKTFSNYSEVKDIKNNIVEIRIKRTDVARTDTVVNTVLFTKVRTWCYDEVATKNNATESDNVPLVPQLPIREYIKNKTARLGFQIESSGQLSGSIGKLNLIATSKCRVWDSVKRAWSEETEPTSNPSAIALYLLTSSIIRGKYEYKDSKIDFDSFGEFYEWCDEDFDFGAGGIKKRFSCDGVVIKKQKTLSLVSDVLACGRGYICLNDNKYGVLIDKPRENVVVILNNHNLISRTNEKSFDDIPDGLFIKFFNRDLDNEEDRIIVFPNGVEQTDESKFLNVEYPYINDAYRCKCMGLYDLAKMLHRPEVWYATVVEDGTLAEVGNKIEIQDDTICVGIGDGAEVTGIIYNDDNTQIVGIETDGLFPSEEDYEYGIKTLKYVDIDGESVPKKVVSKVVFNETGTHSTMMLSEPISVDSNIKYEIGDVISYGVYGYETTPALCVSKKENGDGSFVLTLVPYSDDVYNADSGDLGTFVTNITPPQNVDNAYNDRVTPKELYESQSEINTRLDGLYSNHIVTLYKKSSNVLTREDLPSGKLIYSFQYNTLTWSGSNNGWTDDLSSIDDSTDGTVYIISATAYGQGVDDTINPNEWSTPIPRGQNGTNGYNTYTIQLFKRYAVRPTVPNGKMTYDFKTGILSGNLEGWKRTFPEIDEDNNPCWETHITALSTTDTFEIEGADSWSDVIQVLKESTISMAEIQELINRVAPPPTVNADVTFMGIATDDNGIALVEQSIKTTIKVTQTNEELGFEFGKIELPEGFSYEVKGNDLHLIVRKGTLVKSGSIIVPVKYRAFISNVVYSNNDTDERIYIPSGNIIGDIDDVVNIPDEPEENTIFNWIGETIDLTRSISGKFVKNTAYQYVSGIWKEFNASPYGYYTYQDEYSITNIGIGYTQVKGGRNLSSIESIESIPEVLIVGDFFTWNGEDTESTLVEGGKFEQCCVYIYNGSMWTLDESSDHNTRAIFDILKVANGKLKENNAKAEQYLNRLCSNQAFIKTLVVTGSAFISELQALNIYANQINVAKNEAISSVESDLGVDTLEDKTIIDGGKIKTNLIDTDEIKAKQGFFDNIQVTGVVDAIHIGQSIYAENCDEFLSQMKALLDDKWHTFIGEKDVLCSGYALFQTKYNKVTISINDVYKASTGYIVSGEIVGSNNEGDSSINAEYFGEFPNKDNIFKYYGDLCIKSSSEGSSSNYFGINSISTLQQIYNINKIKLIAIKLNL